jgi:hypothetical protein
MRHSDDKDELKQLRKDENEALRLAKLEIKELKVRNKLLASAALKLLKANKNGN